MRFSDVFGTPQATHVMPAAAEEAVQQHRDRE